MTQLKIATVLVALLLVVAGCAGPGADGPANDTSEVGADDPTTEEDGFGDDTTEDGLGTNETTNTTDDGLGDSNDTDA
jgi:hypothetical protein